MKSMLLFSPTGLVALTILISLAGGSLLAAADAGTTVTTDPAMEQTTDPAAAQITDQNQAKAAQTGNTVSTPVISIKAYYFHGERRCKTCLAIESNTKEIIEKSYADEIAQGLLSWQVVDIDQKDNKHFEQEFELMFSSVILVKYKDGKQVEWKNLQKVWELVWDKPAFEDYIRSEMRTYLES